MTPEQQKLLETGLWAAGIGALGATARIISHKLPYKVAIGTLVLGVVVGVLVGVVLKGTGLADWIQNGAIAIASIAGKEVTEFVVRVSGKLRDKSSKVADKMIDKI
jgi:hypothetical protein